MFIQTEATPNPEVLKFLPGREVLGLGSRELSTREDAAISPLASALFEIEDVARVFLGPDFLTVTRAEGGDWAFLKAPILAAIMDHYTSGRPVLAEGETAETD
ncbi:MAG: NifU family protein, partial [Caulobacteraceae bacterium]|nr:NifU family protein [Caulobacteraceae bacterium]